ncbi:putative ORFan [Tupanvirus deep ocean]|uniref:ORFan n=2 Tax=Tupanvirus TaxID=2094720 RepID=A0AC62A7E5_9VIRU|nr:putative ORFan [Tupanvirus deep ocean]QKU33528.1 putative ORFan [Tupanvirus deep ocean]
MLNSNIDVIIGSSDSTTIETVKLIMNSIYHDANINFNYKKSINNDQSIGINEIKSTAIRIMNNCIPNVILPNKLTYCLGIASSLVLGKDLNEYYKVSNYLESKWYEIGVCAITLFKHGCHFKYVSYSTPIDATNNTNNNTTNKQNELSMACLDAMTKLNNIYVLDPRNTELCTKVDVVILFGTFDLFHDLHKRLIDYAFLVGKTVEINIYNKTFKYNNNVKVSINNDIKVRITNVTTYALSKHRNVIVKRMTESHPNEIRKAISFYTKQKKSIAIFGGDDQFNDYDKIIRICGEANCPIIALSRGETNKTMCSSDIREKLAYQIIANKYDIDLTNISTIFWKTRIRNLFDAKNYLQTKLNFLGLSGAEVWKFNSKNSFDIKVTNRISDLGKTVVCLPGRTMCSMQRLRKIGQTIQNDLIQNDTKIYVVNYEQNNLDTQYHITRLQDVNYFSDDAMIFTKLIIMPFVSKNLVIEKNEGIWDVINNSCVFDSIDTISKRLSNITLWTRSIGSVIALEMENAFRYCMIILGFSEKSIMDMSKQICVLSVCNLASLEIPRLFTTISVTGSNDRKALKYIKFLIPSKNSTFTKLSETHLSLMANIPNKIVESGTNKEIVDNDCHYTPLYTAFRIDGDNFVPNFIRQTLKLMVERTNYFNLENLIPA